MRERLLSILLLLSPGFGWCADESDSSAADETRGWYIGGGYAAGNVFWVDADYGFSNKERGSSDSGFIINGGYRFNPYLAAELGYLDGGQPTFDSVLLDDTNGISIIGFNAEQETEAIELSGVVVLPLLKIWEIYLKAGASIWDATSRQTFTPASGAPENRVVDESGVDFLLGVGGGVSPWENVHIRFEIQAFRTDDKLLGLDRETVDDLEARFDAYTLEVHWRFGAR